MDKSKLLSLASPSKRKPQRDEDHSPEATERRKKFRKSRPQSDGKNAEHFSQSDFKVHKFDFISNFSPIQNIFW